MTTPSSRSSRVYARFIPSEEVSAVSAWKFGLIGEPALELEEELPQAEPPEPEEVKIGRAWSEGHEAGIARGRAEATEEGNRRLDAYVAGLGREHAERLSSLAQDLEARLLQCEQNLGRQVLELACELARQVVRRELSVVPDAALPVVREALGLLLKDGKPALVRLHPEDLAQLSEALKTEFTEPSLTWLADPMVERGGCLVESGGSVVDGQMATRWQRALANLGLEASWEEPAGDD